MRPIAYVHCRTHTDTSRIHIIPNLVIVDVGLFQSMALLHLPITPGPFRTEAEWLKSELCRLSDDATLQQAIDDGLVEFRCADRTTGAPYTKDDVLNQLQLAASVQGGVSKHARAHALSKAVRVG